MSHNQIIVRLVKDGAKAEFKSQKKIDCNHENYYEFEAKGIKPPKWLSFFEEDSIKSLKDDIRKRKNSYLQNITLIDVNDRKFAILFGQYTINLLKDKDIFEDKFAIKTAFQIIDENKITGIKYFDIARLHLKKTVKSAKDVRKIIDETGRSNIFVEEISGAALEKLCPNVKISSVTGNINGSLTLKGEFDINNVSEVCEMLSTHYLSEKNQGKFLWAKNLTIIKNKDELKALNKDLLKAYKNNQRELYEGNDKEIDLEKTQLPDPVSSVTKFKKEKIRLEYTDGTYNDKTNLYKVLIFEQNSKIFIAGEWYEINQNYLNRIENEIKEFQDSKIDSNFFSDYTGEVEGKFNEKCTQEKSMILFDKQSFSLEANRSYKNSKKEKIGEACDLYQDHNFIHIKRFSGKANEISHLFTQANAYSEALKSSQEFREEIIQYLKNYIQFSMGKAIEKIQNSSKEKIKSEIENLATGLENFKPKDYTVTLAFLVDNPENHENINNTSFLCKIGLLDAKQNLENKGFNVKYAWIHKGKRAYAPYAAGSGAFNSAIFSSI